MDRRRLYERALGIPEPPSVEGHWIYLDGGQLDLGLVRDSQVNAANDFQLFGETFEGVAYSAPSGFWAGGFTVSSGGSAA